MFVFYNAKGDWDFVTPEQYILVQCPEVDEKEVPWKSCQTFSKSLGF